MKTIAIYTVLFLLVLSLGACEDALNKGPVDQIAAEEYFTNEANAESGMMGAYRSLQSSYYYGQAFLLVPEFAAGHIRHYLSFPEYLEYQENRIRVDNPWVLNMWTASYNTINIVNNIIRYVPSIGAPMPEEKKNQIVGEARFVRALVYFNLVRSWGDVPLVLEPTLSSEAGPLQVVRSSVQDVYNQIITDLTEASALPDSYATPEISKGRATGFAARALLAKVYLYQGDYSKSATLASEVIEGGGFTLTQDYPSIWVSENSSESIFELQFDEQATNALVGVVNPLGATQFYASDKAYHLFAVGDKRREFTINEVVTADDTTFYIGKYRNMTPPTQNVPVLRLSELFLIYAEAAARQTQAVAGAPWTHYKAIRDRAGLNTPAAGSFTVASFTKAIQEEKRMELLFEAETWYDYVRTGLAATELMENADPGRYLFPIPQAERDLNPGLTQNEAYR